MGSKSNSKQSTTSNFYDNRQVNDAAGGIVGTGNTQDQSITITDNSTTTDAGAIQAAQAVSIKAIDAARLSSAGAVAGAVQVTESAIDASQYTSGRAFDLAETSATQAFSSSGAALNFGRSALDAVAAAQATAQDSATGNKTLIYVGIAAVALVAAVIVFRK